MCTRIYDHAHAVEEEETTTQAAFHTILVLAADLLKYLRLSASGVEDFVFSSLLASICLTFDLVKLSS